ncbi:MAG: cephalosporin hydroxylase family protein [Calditrichia bacterium]|nr:cephalosporin hydroxylase family protein [Calditrichia bacterium]
MNEIEKFDLERKKNSMGMSTDEEFKQNSMNWFLKSCEYKYSYNFSWLGRPIIQYPQDMIAVQEIIWNVKPDLIIETGIAHGGSLIFYASILELIGQGQIIGVDIDIREHNRIEIENHSLYKRIMMIEGSSVDETIIKKISEIAENKERIIIILDSNHTHSHVLKELELYSPLVTNNSYLVVFDTIIEDMPDDFFPDRPWGKGNNPKTAVWEFLKTNDRFEVDKEIESKLAITVAPDGYLKCIK